MPYIRVSGSTTIHERDSLELGDLGPRADVPNVHPAREVTEAGAEQQSALRLVQQEVPRVRAEEVNGLCLGVKRLHSCGHV